MVLLYIIHHSHDFPRRQPPQRSALGTPCPYLRLALVRSYYHAYSLYGLWARAANCHPQPLTDSAKSSPVFRLPPIDLPCSAPLAKFCF